MPPSENWQITFTHDLEKERKNCILEISQKPSFSQCKINASERVANLLALSQPQSIFDRHTQSLKCYGGRSVMLKRSIVLPNNYELFLAPWIADGSFSYTHASIRDDWKQWFPSAHNIKNIAGLAKPTNAIEAKAFDGIKCYIDKRPKFIIKNHIDANNYWHWTFEWLPRLLYLKDLMTSRRELDNIVFINIGSRFNDFQREWIDSLFENSLEIINCDHPVLCENLFWVMPSFPAHHCQTTIASIREHMLRRINDDTDRGNYKYPSKIYLLRGNARNGRRILNEKELVKRLEEIGFASMAMDRLTVLEQARIFSNAEIVVGAHGSAFVNMIFSKRSCKIIELFGPGYMSAHDYSLAYTCGLKWDHLEGVSKQEVPGFTSDFSVDINKLLNRISETLSLPLNSESIDC